MLLTILAATAPEAAAVRRALASRGSKTRVRIVESGIRLARLTSPVFDGPVISCGVAGGLHEDIPTGTVVIADRVLLEDGRQIVCDPVLTEALVAAASDLGTPCRTGALVTSRRLVHGDERTRWAGHGCLAADMETGFIQAPRLAAVRTILDTPRHELSSVWLHPVSVLWHPAAWGQAAWLARHAPLCARRAAEVAARASSRTDLWTPVDEA
jgi:hypothetical protein